jgi:hypothetical protein
VRAGALLGMATVISSDETTVNQADYITENPERKRKIKMKDLKTAQWSGIPL